MNSRVLCRFVRWTAVVVAVYLTGCSQGASIGTEQGSLTGTPEEQVFAAAAKGDVARLKALLTQDATLVDAYGDQGSAPLHAAARFGQNAAVKLLLESGADPLVRDEDGNTPSNMARTEGHPDTAQLIDEAAASKGGGGTQ